MKNQIENRSIKNLPILIIMKYIAEDNFDLLFCYLELGEELEKLKK